MDKLIEIQNLNVSFQSFGKEIKVVRGVTFDIYKGEALALVGESGCGKSVTAKALMGLISKKNGTIGNESKIIYEGTNIMTYNQNQWSNYCGQECAMIFQDAMVALNPTLKIGTQIAENLLVHKKISRKEAKEKAILALQAVGIPEPEKRAEQYPHEFSGGMRQRSMIAMAMVCTPKLLIADEPTTALDVTIQAQILELMKQFKKETKMSLLLITHDLGVVAGIADRIAIMYAGEIVEIGSVREIYYAPRHPYTYSLLKTVPKLNHQVGKRLITIEGMPPDLTELQEGCAFADRCKYCMHICILEKPSVYHFEKGHSASCWLHNDFSNTENCEIKTKEKSNCRI